MIKTSKYFNLLYENLEPANIWYFCLKRNDKQLMKYQLITVFVFWLHT